MKRSKAPSVTLAGAISPEIIRSIAILAECWGSYLTRLNVCVENSLASVYFSVELYGLDAEPTQSYAHIGLFSDVQTLHSSTINFINYLSQVVDFMFYFLTLN